MDAEAIAFLIYAGFFRLGVLVAGVVSLYLGFQLFCRGVFPPDGSNGGGTNVDSKIGNVHLSVKNAAPGTCFALFGALIIVSMIIVGGPSLKSSKGVNQLSENTRGETQLSNTQELVLRGNAQLMNLIEAETQAAKALEKEKNYQSAIVAYDELLSPNAEALNNLAWRHMMNSSLNEALPLAKTAVYLQPDVADYNDTLASIYFESKNYQPALDYIKIAAQLDSRYQNKLAVYREMHNDN